MIFTKNNFKLCKKMYFTLAMKTVDFLLSPQCLHYKWKPVSRNFDHACIEHMCMVHSGQFRVGKVKISSK